MDEPQDPREARANQLYWESDDSVNQIADDLDLSKGTLYAIIEPLPAGLSCPRCHAETEFPNRTARDKGFLTCPACGLEEDRETVDRVWQEAEERRTEDGRGEPELEPGIASDGTRRAPSPRLSGERIVVGTALLGVAAGFLIGRLTGRK